MVTGAAPQDQHLGHLHTLHPRSSRCPHLPIKRSNSLGTAEVDIQGHAVVMSEGVAEVAQGIPGIFDTRNTNIWKDSAYGAFNKASSTGQTSSTGIKYRTLCLVFRQSPRHLYLIEDPQACHASMLARCKVFPTKGLNCRFSRVQRML